MREQVRFSCLFRSGVDPQVIHLPYQFCARVEITAPTGTLRCPISVRVTTKFS